jgi:hypothetical protein
MEASTMPLVKESRFESLATDPRPMVLVVVDQSPEPLDPAANIPQVWNRSVSTIEVREEGPSVGENNRVKEAVRSGVAVRFSGEGEFRRR